jgi:hypothetical protein
MLHRVTSPHSAEPTHAVSATRSIDQILARHQARLHKREHAFPPDFRHGEARLDEVYGVFGERWVEQAIFVEEFYDEAGELVAFTAAWFEGRFLHMEQAVRDEIGDVDGRLDDLKDGRRSVVRLCIDGQGVGDDDSELTVCCSLGRLLQLELERLAVVRDKEVCDRRAIYSRRDEILQDSHTNILSTICLFARLA